MRTSERRYIEWEGKVFVWLGKEYQAGRISLVELFHYANDPFALWQEAICKAVGVKSLNRYRINHGYGDQLGAVFTDKEWQAFTM